MRRPLAAAVVAATVIAGSAVWAGAAAAAGGSTPATPTAHAPAAGATVTEHGTTYRTNCDPTPQPGHAACLSMHRAEAATPQAADATPSGLGPSDLQSAYGVTGGDTAGTVAVVDAYDNPDAESDLATYRSQFGLPACTSADGCFTKLNQSGRAGDYPQSDTGWAGEISLDLQMVSAICPQCRIVLVEANSASFADLGAAEDTAAQHATVVSNSFGGGDASDSTYGKYYDHSGVTITASSGDDGYQGGSYPASSAHVIAVGGTSLSRASGTRGWSETAWSGTGSGCSSTNAAIPGSENSDTGCGDRRAMNDVAADADPNTGVAVYDSFGGSGWAVYGGTSASAPIIAGLVGSAGAGGQVTPSSFYGKPDDFFDITSGSNGTCSPSQLCTARAGWDGPTGNGSPDGLAFTASGG